MNDKKLEEEMIEAHDERDSLAEKQADAQDWAMTIADDPELVELYGLEK